MEHTKKRLWLKILCIVLAVFIAIAAALGITVACLWGNEIATVASFKQRVRFTVWTLRAASTSTNF